MDRIAVDELAKKIAITKYALPLCLHIPIAARNEDALSKYVGRIIQELGTSGSNKAFVVQPHIIPEINKKLPIWSMMEASILHKQKQVWVHVNYRSYRKAYIKAFPEEDIKGLVMDHILNRRVARLKGYNYIRIVPISRGANSSSGGLCEKWSVEYHSSPKMIKFNKENPTFIQYADLADIVKMMNIKTGGSLQDPVNEAQGWLKEV